VKTPNLIHLKNVTREYPIGDGKVAALRDITLEIPPGVITLITGPSGSGKSTLLNIIGSIDLPDTGEVIVNGNHIELLNRDQRADYRNINCGFIFQNFNLIPVLSAVENVTLPQQICGTNTAHNKEYAMTLLNEVGLGDFSDFPVNRLSGGQMQRVAIARSLINHPNIILADEPTANLDHKTALDILELLKKMIILTPKTSIIIATHDMSLLEYADLHFEIVDGQLLQNQ
jgi:putative ABC transport system ATP-binding protein